MDKFKVSCIVPVYNLQDKVSVCIESLLNQTINNLEIILVNDCSTDESLSVLKKYEVFNDSVKVIDLKENLKQGGARNRGLESSQGKYVIFIDGDDWVERTMISELYLCAEQNNADIVDSDFFQVDEQGHSEIRTSIPEELIYSKETKKLILNPGRLWTKLIRKQLLVENKLRFIEHKRFEDNPFLPIVFAYTNKVFKVNKPFYHYIYNTSSTSRKKNDYNVFDRLDTARFLIYETRRRGIYKNYKDEYDFLFIQFFYTNSVVTCITKFDYLPIKYVISIYDEINKILPDYKMNKYISESPKYIKIIVKMNKNTLLLLCRGLSIMIRFGFGSIVTKVGKGR